MLRTGLRDTGSERVIPAIMRKDKEGGRMAARILEYTACGADSGRLVRDIIKKEFGLVSHDISRAKYRTENGVTVNGESVRVNFAVKPGDCLKVVLSDEMSGKIVPSDSPLNVLYEDEDLIVLDKPAGIVVHPSHGHYADSLANRLAGYYLKNGEEHEVRTVGRLDRDTSGAVIFGKNRTAVSKLMDQAADGRREKIYLALASGRFAENEGKVEAPIEREFSGSIKRVAAEGGDAALTYYRVLRQYEGYALLEVRIATGRTHQIRVHMSCIGHPLLGDSLYGEGTVPGLARTALHSYRTEFFQPFSGKKITVQAELPPDMRAFVVEYPV